MRWTAPITASTVSERIEALSRPPVVSSPRPSLTWSPSPMRAADPGQRAGVDDRRAQLGQLALGEVGVGAVERLGHDDAEHRVAEELQALVGRQAAVLVGERAVRQGALEQLGVERGIAERATRAGRSCQRTGSGSEDLATVGAGAVLAAGAARAVRQVLGTARGVGAGHQGRRDGLPLRTTVARVAARHLPLRDCHCSLLVDRSGGPSVSRPARARSAWPGPPTAGRPARSCVWSGSSASRAPHSAHNPGQSSSHNGWNGSASTTASRSSGSRSTRSSCEPADLELLVRVDVAVVVHEQLLEPHLDLVGDRLQAPRALALEPGSRRTRDQDALHDRLEPQVELDRRAFGDTEDLDAQICWSRHRPRHLALGPRAATELACIEHERRSRVQFAQGSTSGSGHNRSAVNRIHARGAAAKRSRARRARRAGAPRRRATRASWTKSGTRPETSPPNAATSLTRDEARNDHSGLVGHEHRLDVGQRGVHLRHLELVVEVADGAQPLDDRVDVALGAERREQAGEALDATRWAGRRTARREHRDAARRR